mmetsp:Transcript_5020/g.14809  ORF Transcript_5020/g.14809 Transcript_5020/m.14809 type:complete len:262 (-) Transcript_5020:435-1220(-)
MGDGRPRPSGYGCPGHRARRGRRLLRSTNVWAQRRRPLGAGLPSRCGPLCSGELRHGHGHAPAPARSRQPRAAQAICPGPRVCRARRDPGARGRASLPRGPRARRRGAARRRQPALALPHSAWPRGAPARGLHVHDSGQVRRGARALPIRAPSHRGYGGGKPQAGGRTQGAAAGVPRVRDRHQPRGGSQGGGRRQAPGGARCLLHALPAAACARHALPTFSHDSQLQDAQLQLRRLLRAPPPRPQSEGGDRHPGAQGPPAL